MEIKDFIQNFADQFDETEADVFTAETVFHELDEWSSLIMTFSFTLLSQGMWNQSY